MWVEKYRPRTISEVVGNEQAKEEFVKWVRKWLKKEVQELGVFFIGPQGVGKTSLAYAAANDFGFHLVELNASDVRTKERLLEKLGPVAGAIALDSFMGSTFKRKDVLVFLDEVDGIYGQADRGGLQAIMEIANQKNTLLVLSANFPDPVKHKDLLKNFKQIHFRPLTPRQIVLILKRITKEEGLKIDAQTLTKIANKSGGDARFAINALQLIASGYVSLDELGINFTTPLAEAVNSLINSRTYREAMDIISYALARPDEIYRALAEAVATSRLDSKKKAEILDVLSRIDVLWGKIRKTQRWKLMREMIMMLASVPSLIPKGRVKYVERIPDYVFMKVIHKSKADQINEITNRLKRRLHCSKRKIIHDVLPYLTFMLKGNVKLRGFNKSEKELLIKAVPVAGK